MSAAPTSLPATGWALYGPATPAAVAPWPTAGRAVSYHGAEYLGTFADAAEGLAAIGRRGLPLRPMPGARITAADLGGMPARLFSQPMECDPAYRRFIAATTNRSGRGVDLWAPLYAFPDRAMAETWAESMNDLYDDDFDDAEFAVLTCAGDGGILQ